MIHHVVHFRLKPGVPPEQLERLLIETRILLLRIPEVMNLKTGKIIDPKSKWHFFVCFDCESLAKLAGIKGHPVHVKFERDVVEPCSEEALPLDYEMDPGKDVRYS
ncbi:MAG: Dabb family protein [Verrucomicrobiae bacterium]|nr:Dabb family protein [Verrucomicrobiae bacterium]